MSSSWSCAILLLFVSLRTLRGAPSVSLNQTGSIDVLSGNAVCSNSTVEFTCIASDVETLGWEINEAQVDSWHIPSTSLGTHYKQRGPIGLYLDKINTSSSANKVSSRLIGRVNQGLYTGNEITCLTLGVEDSLNLSYSIVMGQRPPKPDFDYELHSTNSSSHSITFIWDLVFSTNHAIESYNITPATTFSDTVSCPTSCPFDRPCVCNITGKLPVEGVDIAISAINCDNVEGPNTTITVLPKDCQTETFGTLLGNQDDSLCKHDSIGSTVIPNGVACFDGNTSGSILSYQCNDGYTLVGSTNQICLSDGRWSGEVPNCQPLVVGWMIALATVSPLIWIVSSVLIIVWSILYHKLFLWTRVAWKISTFAGVLVVGVTLQLAVIIVWSMFVDTARTQNSPFVGSRSSLVITTTVLSIMALVWMSSACLVSILYSYYSSSSDEHIRIEKWNVITVTVILSLAIVCVSSYVLSPRCLIATLTICWETVRENELYYLGRSLRSDCQEEPRKESLEETVGDDDDDYDRVYDRISHNSDIMAEQEILDDSFTDSEGYIRTTQQQLRGVMIMERITEAMDSGSYCV